VEGRATGGCVPQRNVLQIEFQLWVTASCGEGMWCGHDVIWGGDSNGAAAGKVERSFFRKRKRNRKYGWCAMKAHNISI
jgi:hypothetical protein